LADLDFGQPPILRVSLIWSLITIGLLTIKSSNSIKSAKFCEKKERITPLKIYKKNKIARMVNNKELKVDVNKCIDGVNGVR
jgi:hypothetical protein